jgi:hypothetical protein
LQLGVAKIVDPELREFTQDSAVFCINDHTQMDTLARPLQSRRVPCNLDPICPLPETRNQLSFIEAGIPVTASEGSPAVMRFRLD